MAKVHYRFYSTKQIIFFPQRIDEDIVENDPVRIVSDIVDNLDIGSFHKLPQFGIRNLVEKQSLLFRVRLQLFSSHS